jgi:hypothetical protein
MLPNQQKLDANVVHARARLLESASRVQTAPLSAERRPFAMTAAAFAVGFVLTASPQLRQIVGRALAHSSHRALFPRARSSGCRSSGD